MTPCASCAAASSAAVSRGHNFPGRGTLSVPSSSTRVCTSQPGSVCDWLPTWLPAALPICGLGRTDPMVRIMRIRTLPRSLSALVIAVVVFCGSIPLAGASNPGLILDPDAGPPGTNVTVNGSGFCATAPCTPVSIEFNGAPLIQGIHVAASGNFQVTVRVPNDTHTGSNEVVAFQATSPSPPQAMQAVTYFAVTSITGAPEPDLSPTTNSPHTFPATTSPSVGTRTSTTLRTITSTTVANSGPSPSSPPKARAQSGATTIPRAPKPSSPDPAETLLYVILILAVSMAAILAGASYRRRRARRG